MCIAIYISPHKKISKGRLRAIHQTNPDGYGIMWPHIITKGVGSFDSFSREYYRTTRFLNLTPCVLHFRTASTSTISDDHCHPHKVNDNLSFVHNGNLFEFSEAFDDRYRYDGKSDTIRFNEQILRNLPEGFLKNTKIRKLIENYCKQNLSKMIFMDSDGNVDIINESAGMWKDGIWYSNGGFENYVGYGFSGVYPYKKGDCRHKGGLYSVNVLPETTRKNYHMCAVCGGYYRDVESLCCGCKCYLELKGEIYARSKDRLPPKTRYSKNRDGRTA